MDPWILGLGGTHHNGSACLLHGDRIIAAVQEERLIGIKRYPLDFGAHSLSVQYCLDAAGITADELDLIVCCPTGWSKEPNSEILASPTLAPLRHRIPVHFVPHHLSHAAGAYATSGFTDAAILVVDGMGSPYSDLTREERLVVASGLGGGSEAHSFYLGTGNCVVPLEKHLIEEGRWRCYNSRSERVDLVSNPIPLAPPDFSMAPKDGMGRFFGLGHMYDQVSLQVFGDPHNGPGKLMGLAPYGTPSFAPTDFFQTKGGTFDFLSTVPDAFRHHDRWPKRKQQYSDLAAATQSAFEVGMLHLVTYLREISKSENLVLAGGCALNSVANERIHLQRCFQHVYIIPAAEDSGIAVGAAYLGYWLLGGKSHGSPLRRDSFGRTYRTDEVDAALNRLPMLESVATTDAVSSAVELLASGKIVALFQGGSELGPRALGQRSILCDPRRPDAKDFLNERVKFREGFRPFAPAIIKSEVDKWFMLDNREVDSPFMLRVLSFREGKRMSVPGVVHVDGTGRLQTVTAEDGGILYECLRRMFERTDVPILLNTSFNLQGEPIVETPEDALWTLVFSGIDACLFEGRLVAKRPIATSPLDLIVLPTAEVIRQDKRNITLITQRHYLGRQEWALSADVVDLPVVAAIVELAASKPSGRELISNLRNRFPSSRRMFMPPDDGHALALIRRGGLIDLSMQA